MNQEKIGKFIAECRKKKKITQSELADKLSVTNKTVSRWENGHYLPDVSLFNDLCTILDIEVVELLNGEKSKNSIDKKEVDETIMKIVNISKEEIKEKKKKIIIISSFVILLIVIVFSIILTTMDKDKYERPNTGDEAPFVSQIAVKEKEDGWVCYMSLEYFKSDTKAPYHYGYNCENLKYKRLKNFMAVGVEENETGKYTYDAGANHPQYSYNETYRKELIAIDDYFIKNKFNKEISLEELKGLNLKVITKEEVIELYNKAIVKPKVYKWGNVPMDNHPTYLTTSMMYDEYTWYVGYIINFGHVEYVNIELTKNDKYISNLVADNAATEEEKEIYNNINKIETYIIEKQKFELPKEYSKQKPYVFLSDNFGEINCLEDK